MKLSSTENTRSLVCKIAANLFKKYKDRKISMFQAWRLMSLRSESSVIPNQFKYINAQSEVRNAIGRMVGAQEGFQNEMVWRYFDEEKQAVRSFRIDRFLAA